MRLVARACGFENDAVYHRLQRVVLALFKPHTLFDLGHLAVDAQAIAFLVERLDLFTELALAAAHDRRKHRDALCPDALRVPARRSA